MNSWNYLKDLRNNKCDYYQRCAYCGNTMNILTKSFTVEFKTPKIPPIGARDLNLFNITYKTYLKSFVLCENCEAKYDYDIFATISTPKALTNIPSSKTLIKNILENELPKLPRNKTCKVIRKGTSYKRVLNKKSNFVYRIPFYRLINSSFSKLYYIFQSLTAIFQYFGLGPSYHVGFGSESKTARVYSREQSQVRKPTPAEITNLLTGDS
ncbi:MAG: hypothetical protein WC600_13150 [Desulfobaccales bacterium]